MYEIGTVLHNPVTGEYARLVEHEDHHVVGELIALPGGAVAGPHRHPGQDEHFEVLSGLLGYRRGDERGELRPGESLTVPAGVVHDWWNAGGGNLRARVTVTPPGRFMDMIGAVWGLAVLDRVNAKGMPGPLDVALLAEAFGREIVFERPPAWVQRALVRTVAPLARARGRRVDTDEVVRAAIVAEVRWPGDREIVAI
jgi:quercetin dioxygenase-like cupin family protein